MLLRPSNVGTVVMMLALTVSRSAAQATQDSERTTVLSAGVRLPRDLERLAVSELLEQIAVASKDRDTPAGTMSVLQVELRSRAERRRMSDGEWRMALLATDVIHTRPKWPVGEPLLVWIHEPMWLPLTKITVRAIEPALGEVAADNTAPSTCGNANMWEHDQQRKLALEALPADVTSVHLDVIVEQLEKDRENWFENPSLRQLWHGQLDLPIQSVSSLEQCLPRTVEPQQTAAIRESMRSSWLVPIDAPPPALSYFAGGDYLRFPALRGVGLSLAIEIRHDGVVVNSCGLLADEATRWKRSDGLRGSGRLFGLPRELLEPDADFSGWDIRVVGYPTHLLGVWEVDRWWGGEFVMPLAEALGNRNPK